MYGMYVYMCILYMYVCMYVCMHANEIESIHTAYQNSSRLIIEDKSQ